MSSTVTKKGCREQGVVSNQCEHIVLEEQIRTADGLWVLLEAHPMTPSP